MSWFRNHRAQYRLGLRITLAGLLSYGFCGLFGLSPTYPAVLTAVIVMQASVGASLKAMLDRFIGSLGGAVWAVAVLFAVQHFDQFQTGVVLLAGLAPLALLAAFKPEYRAAPTAAIILLLIPGSIAGPLAPAIQRMLGIGLGSVVALFVSLLVFPARAQGPFAETAGIALAKMSELAAILLRGVIDTGDPEKIQSLHDDIRKSIHQAELIAEEVLRETASHLSDGPDPLPMCRALRRIRNDLAMIGRVTSQPFPELIRMPLSEPAAAVAAAVASFLSDCGEAISRQKTAPLIERCGKELEHFGSTLTEFRRNGQMRDLPDDTVGRIFGLAFSLEQLYRNLEDLGDRIRELTLKGK